MANNLTELQVQKARCPADQKKTKLGDGNNLYLQIKANQSKTWLFCYRLHGKANQLVLGHYGNEEGCMSLADARKSARAMRAKLDMGINPAEERRQQKKRPNSGQKRANDKQQPLSPSLNCGLIKLGMTKGGQTNIHKRFAAGLILTSFQR